MTEPPIAEKTIIAKPAITESLRAEQIVSTEHQMTEQAVAAQNTPPPSSEDKGYGHRIILDSMIVTPRIPTLVEDSTDVRIEREPETSEEIQEGFAANSSSSEKVDFMKQSTVTLIYVANVVENESQAHVEMIKLAEDRLEKIKSLESQLNEEKIISSQLQQDLNKANEELQLLRKEKELTEQSRTEAIQKVEEFKVLYNKSQVRVDVLEKEIAD